MSVPEISLNFSIFLFENVQNMVDVRQAAVDGKLHMVLVNPSLILHPCQIIMALNKSLQARKHRQMKTRNVFTEILYSLSPSKNIRDSFKSFGVNDSSTSVIVIVSGADTDSIQNDLSALICGSIVSIHLLPKFHDIELIRKMYKIQYVEADELLESIISRIAVKDYV